MKKTLKIVLVAVGALVVLLVVVAAIALASLDSIIKTGVERGGTYALKVQVRLDSAKVSVFKGQASLTGFSVANPAGFSNGPALAFGEITAAVKPLSVNRDPVEIPEIIVRKPEIAIEGTLTGETNVGRLMKNLDETLAGLGAGGQAPAGKPAAKPAEPAPKGAAKRLKLDHLVLENPGITVAATLLGQTQQKTITLGKVEFTGLAKEYPQGMTAAELSKKVLDELLRRALKDQGEIGKALQKLLDKGALGTVKSIAGDATKLGKDVLNDPSKAQELIKDPKKATEGSQDVKDLKDAGKGIKDLFKK